MYCSRGTGLCFNSTLFQHRSKIPYDNYERGSQKAKSVASREWGDFKRNVSLQRHAQWKERHLFA